MGFYGRRVCSTKKILLKVKKVIYLLEQPFDERNYERLGVETWIARGWSVEVWDLTSFLHPCVWERFIKRGSVKNIEGYCSFGGIPDVMCALRQSSNVQYVLDFTGNSFFTLLIKLYLVLRGINRIVCRLGVMPEPINDQTSFIDLKIYRFLNQGPKFLLKHTITYPFRKCIEQLIKPKVMIFAGLKGWEFRGKANNFINAHSFDYDIYLNIKNGQSTQSNVVFIDQDYCKHPDFLYENVDYPVTAAKYLPAIAGVLQKIATTFNIDICIAAHPRSQYSSQEIKYLKKLPIRLGETAELIRDSAVVVCHDSTAIQLAVLFKKPIVIITTDEINASIWGASIKGMAVALGKSIINIDRELDDINWQAELSIDYKKYKYYKEQYIKYNVYSDKKLWDIILDSLEKKIYSNNISNY